ncbi:transmembrane protein 18 [Hyalella azteca]|uniref:Transmembrane protein 18 n=1 Tax=Hyalella azteca TaxID=294128 RepID=A0A8B7NRW0_HYAAZ|nr:transmembrane protein 18 [Hyalella azteca]
MDHDDIFLDSSSFVATDQITGIWSFLMSIDWSEGWLQATLASYIILIVTILLLRHFFYVLVGLFLLILSVVYNAETINKYGAQNWNKFSRQQYFDSSGMFISLVFSLPLICISLFIMILWVYQSAHLLISLKRKELIGHAECSTSKNKKDQ